MDMLVERPKGHTIIVAAKYSNTRTAFNIVLLRPAHPNLKFGRILCY